MNLLKFKCAESLLEKLIRRQCEDGMRSALIERLLFLRIDDAAFTSIKDGLAKSDKSWADYYTWKLRQFALMARLSKKRGENLLDELKSMDKTDYSSLLNLPTCGILLAVPHYGHFTHSIIGITERMRGKRKVCIFYDSPSEHSSNAVFDSLEKSIYNGTNSYVEIIHNNRKGVFRALRSLRDGALVVIMPDVYDMKPVPYLVPFAGSSRFAPFGTAFLSRKTNSYVLPVVSHPTAESGFRTSFGKLIRPGCVPCHADAMPEDLWQDYFLTRDMFLQIDQLMLGNYVPWQYLSSHFVGTKRLIDVDSNNLEQVLSAFEADPRIRNEITHVLT